MEDLRISARNDISLIKAVMAGAVAYAQTIGFSGKECSHIELILEEVLSNIIKYEYLPGQQGLIETEMQTTTLGIGITLKTTGIPMDTDAIKTFEHVKIEDILYHDAHGLGMLLIKNLADNVVYTNKGKEGQAIWIEKYLPHKHINHDEALPPAPEDPVEEAARVNFYIRRIKPEESPVISRLAYYTYNLTYIYDHIYYPERVRQLNEKGELMSYVAVNTANEEIVGHCALIKDDLSEMREMAVAFVNPAYRGSGCLKELSKYQLAEIEKMGADGVFVHAVTTHPYSQKAAMSMGLGESALFISRLTVLKMNKLNTENENRESLLFQCSFFKTRQHKNVFAPPHHRDMITKILKNIGVDIELCETAAKPNGNDSEMNSAIETKSDAYLCGHIFVKQYGNDIQKRISKTLKAYCVSRIETVYLYLPLDSPETAQQCSAFEALGFFFGGLRPGNDGSIWLLLQYLNNQKYDYESLRFCSPFGQELMDYIRNLDPNTENE
ncbi:MAG: ATP-binding protein [Bacteroidota bacterium]